MVVKLDIVLTMPEQVLCDQEDPCDLPPTSLNKDEEDEQHVKVEPRMYFISKGRFDVYIKKHHITVVSDDAE